MGGSGARPAGRGRRPADRGRGAGLGALAAGRARAPSYAPARPLPPRPRARCPARVRAPARLLALPGGRRLPRPPGRPLVRPRTRALVAGGLRGRRPAAAALNVRARGRSPRRSIYRLAYEITRVSGSLLGSELFKEFSVTSRILEVRKEADQRFPRVLK